MKITTLIVLMFCSSMTFSCLDGGGVEGSPEESLKTFIEKIKERDFEGAKEFASAETDPAMDFLAQRIETLKAMGKEQQVADLFGGIDLGKATSSCETKEDNAKCQLCEEAKDKCKDIQVIQEGGKWLVHIPKETTIE